MMRRFSAELKGKARSAISSVGHYGLGYQEIMGKARAKHDAYMEIASLLDSVFGRAEDDL